MVKGERIIFVPIYMASEKVCIFCVVNLLCLKFVNGIAFVKLIAYTLQINWLKGTLNILPILYTFMYNRLISSRLNCSNKYRIAEGTFSYNNKCFYVHKSNTVLNVTTKTGRLIQVFRNQHFQHVLMPTYIKRL